MTAQTVDLVGSKGYTHGWIYHGIPGQKVADMTPGVRANLASRRAKTAVQHAHTARLHRAAARGLTGAAAKRHTRLANYHNTRASEIRHGHVGSEPARPKMAKTTFSRGKALKAIRAAQAKAPGGLRSRPPATILATELARHVPIDPKIKLGSGGRFKKMKSKLAARGARNPGALAAYIGRRAYGAKKFAALGRHAHANTGPALEMAFRADEKRDELGRWASTVGGRGIKTDKPPAHRMSADELRSHLANYHGGAPIPPSLRGTSRRAKGKAALVAHHEAMHRMLAGERVPGNLVNQGVGHSHGMSASYANTGPAVELAMRYPRYPVSSPYDVLVVRGEDGQAIIRHRRGGYEIARIRRTDEGSWVAAVDGQDGTPHTRQRGALLEAIGQHNKASGSPYHRPVPQGEPLQPPPVQTPLMAAYGIPAVRALATPSVGATDGPRTTSRDGGGPTAGLGQKGAGIYKKLKSRGFPHERAHNFARRAERRARK